jgi:hypothetical protein
MKVEYNGFITNEFDTTSTDEGILSTFKERHMIFDPVSIADGDEFPRMIIQWPDLTFEDLTVTRTSEETKIIGKKYLADTDWYVSRKAEADIAIPADILALRQQARLDASS